MVHGSTTDWLMKMRMRTLLVTSVNLLSFANRYVGKSKGDLIPVSLVDEAIIFMRRYELVVAFSVMTCLLVGSKLCVAQGCVFELLGHALVVDNISYRLCSSINCWVRCISLLIIYICWCQRYVRVATSLNWKPEGQFGLSADYSKGERVQYVVAVCS
jgi:hypothetical protein